MSSGLLALLFCAAPCAELAFAQPGVPIILRTVEVAGEGDAVVVMIDADGPLPMPATGRLDAPPRFFLDFPGVIAGTRGSTGELGPAVKRVRVALNSSNPPVTRVVLDLAQQLPVQVQAEAREGGRLRLVIGPAASSADNGQQTLIGIPSGAAAAAEPEVKRAADEPLPQVSPMPQATAGRVAPEPAAAARAEAPPAAVYPLKSVAPPSKPSSGDVNRYREQTSQPVQRLRLLRNLLSEIDRQDVKPPEGLPAARAELGAVIRVLAGIQPPDSLKPTHDLLLRSASLAMMSATLRADAGMRTDVAAIRNASSAAAGALLLLDRVCIEIGCSELPDPK